MSARGKRRSIVWILVILLLVYVTAQGANITNPLLVLPSGYRAYSWFTVYHVETKWFPESIKTDMILQIRNDFAQQTKQKLTEYTDEHGDKLVVSSGPDTKIVGAIEYTDPVYRFVGSLYLPTVTAIFNLNVTSTFYGYFPNGIPDVPAVNRFTLFPVALALAPLIIAAIIVAICAAVITLGIVALVIYTENKIIEVLKDPDIPDPFKWLFTIIAAIMSFGPVLIVVVAGIFVFYLFSGMGRRRGS